MGQRKLDRHITSCCLSKIIKISSVLAETTACQSSRILDAGYILIYKTVLQGG